MAFVPQYPLERDSVSAVKTAKTPRSGYKGFQNVTALFAGRVIVVSSTTVYVRLFKAPR
jgi:hypothetical protein